LRKQLELQYPDLLFLHAGDFLFPSLLSETYKGKQMISVLNLLDGEEHTYDDRFFVTFGNHEFEKSRMKDTLLLESLIDSSEFAWLGSNIRFKSTESCSPVIESENIVQHAIMMSNGIKVGLFSLTTDVKFPEYVDSFEDPVTIARQMTAMLRRKGAEVIVALTHLNVSQDKHILQTLGKDGPDLIIGGHEHDEQSHTVNGRLVLKANADATSAVVAKVRLRPGAAPEVTFEFKKIDASIEPDPVVLQNVDSWFAQYDHDYCAQNNLPEGCTKEKYSFAAVDLIAEELRIRKYETNLGNWIADQVLNAFQKENAQVAFINSGSIRLNQNILQGDAITRSHINEMFPYKNKLKLIRITGADLQRIVDRAVTDWTGNGWWLQIAGFAFTFNPETGKAEHLTLTGIGGSRRILPGDQLLAVTTDYLMDPGGDQDGFTMLHSEMAIPSSGTPVLTDVIVQALKKYSDSGIRPMTEGRICNSAEGGKCLAIVD
jgi:2',3'-cyclic-nucleotide 2'-phosphodiesterase (5'-nucleotidase family)